MLRMEAPSLKLEVPADRPYGLILQQTKQVYDRLLQDKLAKLNGQLLQRKAQFDEKCSQVAQMMGEEKALEYGVRAQNDLQRIQQENNQTLDTLYEDYQHKLTAMRDMYEDKWVKEGKI